MPKQSRQVVEAETQEIRRLMVDLPAEQIRTKLEIPRSTYYTYIKRIQKEDAKVWDKVHMDSAKYRATQLINSFEECYYFNRAVMNNERVDNRTRIEASKTMCEAQANILKLVLEGPTFKTSAIIETSYTNVPVSITNSTSEDKEERNESQLQ